MPMERRDARDVAQCTPTPEVCKDGPFKGYVRLDWIHSAAANKGDERCFTLMHHLNVHNLRRAFQELDGTKAPGIDCVTKDQYRRDLDENLERLAQALRGGGWRPRPSRQVLIPKPQGGMRPLAIGCLEDKIVQTLVARILEALFDPIFSARSYGFRRSKSAHQAVGRLYETIYERRDHAVAVEMDIEKFFDSVNHEVLMVWMETKIGDSHFLRLIRRLLRADVLKADGSVDATEVGTPQGSPVSPILANIYLHFLLDDWFDQSHDRDGSMVRYADDAVFVFDDADTALKFRSALEARLSEGGLHLNLDKSAIVPFSQHAPEGTVSFLGFEFFWGRDANRRRKLKVKTASPRLHRGIQSFKEWIKATRNQKKLSTLWKLASAKLRGHFNYFGVLFNEAKLNYFYHACVGCLFKWINRRSQRRSMNWERFKRRLSFEPLALPPHGKDLRDVSSERLSDKHKPKSRMRETRKSGSVRSTGWKHPVFT
jgi:RNA-directed DNA polymerase